MDLHVFHRIGTKVKEAAPTNLSVKLKRKWTFVGKKTAKPTAQKESKLAKSAIGTRPALAAILENSSKAATPTRSRSLRSLAPPREDSITIPKYVDPAVSEKQFRRQSWHERAGSVVSSALARATSAVTDVRNSPAPIHKVHAEVQQLAAADAASDKGSQKTDNTEVLCSKDVVEKAFSYAEEDGINHIHNWLELCQSTTHLPGSRGRSISRSGSERILNKPNRYDY